MSGLLIFVLLAIIALFVLLTLVFLAAETALLTSSSSKLHRLKKDYGHDLKIIYHLKDNMHSVVSILLMGNTLSNVIISSLATGVAIEFFGDKGVAYSTLINGILIVYLEVVTKIYTITNPEWVLLKLAKVVDKMVRYFGYMIDIIQYVAKRNLDLLGLSSQAIHVTGSEEIRSAIDMHADVNTLEEKAMMHSILDLGNISVSHIITHRKNVIFLDINLTAQEIVDQVLSCPSYTRFPLCDGDVDNIIGIINSKSLLRDAVMNEKTKVDLSIEQIRMLATIPWYIPESTSLYDQLQAFRTRREHFAIVIDEYGSVLGIITLEDILEEIVGDIIDEYDVKQNGIKPQNDGSYLVDGAISIRDLNRQMAWKLPDDTEASTVAGLLLYTTRDIPEIGQIFTINGFRLEVMKRSRNQITSIKVSRA